MKKSIQTLMLLCAVLLLASCGLSKQDAVNYNDNIIEQQTRAVNALDLVFNSMRTFHDHAGMDTAYQAAQQTIAACSTNVAEMSDFDENTDFRDATLSLLKAYQDVLDKEIKEMIEINKLPDSSFTSERKEAFGKLQTEVLDRLEKELAGLLKVQREFAEKYDFVELLKNEEYKKDAE